MKKLFLLAIVTAALWGCQTGPEGRYVLTDDAVKTVMTVKAAAEAVEPVIPAPFNAIALAIAGLAGGVLHGQGKIKSFNKATELAKK